MSLINQMLKDLEQRRADSVASPDSPLKGVNRYSVARPQRPYLLYALAGLLLVLAGVVGFLGWAYLNAPSAQQVAAPSPTVEPAVTPAPSTRTPLQTARVDAEPAIEPDKPSVQADPVRTAPAKPRPAEKADTSAPAKDDSVRRTPSSRNQDDESVTKRSRPLSGEQQAELAYKKGYQLLAREQTEAGMRHLREALAHYRYHHRARELLAGVYIKGGRYVEAATLLKEGVVLAPEHSLFAKLYARVLIRQDQLAQAIAVLEHQPPMPGVDSEYHALLAAIYQQNGDYLKAAGSYRDVLRVNPDQGSWWVGLGVSLEQLGKHDEARSAYQRAKNSANLTENLKQYADKRLAVLGGAGS